MTDTQNLTTRVFERHLDLLLAQELECNDEFFQWFMDQASGGHLYDTALAYRTVVVGHWDPMEHDSQNAGEDDLYVNATLQNGQRVVLLIENKVDAVLQPNQIERYQARAQRHEQTVGNAFVIVVAPQSYLTSHEHDVAEIVGVSIEEIARELMRQSEMSSDELADRLRWTANRMTRLQEARRSSAIEYPPTIELRDYLVESIRRRDSSIVPRLNSMRTVNTKWLYMVSPSSVVLKVSHGLVDIYLRDIPSGPTAADLKSSKASIPEGFELTRDSSGNDIVRFGTSSHTSIDQIWSNGKATDPQQLELLVEATVRAARWVSAFA